LTFGLPRVVLKRELERGRARTSNGRGAEIENFISAAVVFKREGSHAFDFWSTTRNLEVSWHEEEFERATPSGRPPSRPRFLALLTFGLPRAIMKRARTRKGPHKQRRGAARPRFLPCSRAIMKRARTRKGPHKQRRGAAVVFGTNAVTLLTFGLPRAIMKRARMRESSHEQRRGVVPRFLPRSSPGSRPCFCPPFRPILKRARTRERVRTSDAVVPQSCSSAKEAKLF
jgi:hypothetical protein